MGRLTERMPNGNARCNYEDTGLSPERVTELAEAERDGRLIVLPQIKRNKTLYWIWGNEIMPVQYKGISNGHVNKKTKILSVIGKMETKKPRTFIHGHRSATIPAGSERFFKTEDLGETIFLTREEAEASLNNTLAPKADSP